MHPAFQDSGNPAKVPGPAQASSWPRTVKTELKTSAWMAALVALLQVLAFGVLWIPHGLGSVALHYVGLFGIAPLLYVLDVLENQLGFAGIVIACMAQFLWALLWVLAARRVWKMFRKSRNSSRS